MQHVTEQCKVLNFKDLGDERGKLVVVEGDRDIPFDIQRVFYIYGSDSEVVRGQHANRESEFVLINPMMGLYIPTMVWKDMYDFSEDSILLVLASTHYNGSEYIRDYEEYKKEMGAAE